MRPPLLAPSLRRRQTPSLTAGPGEKTVLLSERGGHALCPETVHRERTERAQRPRLRGLSQREQDARSLIFAAERPALPRSLEARVLDPYITPRRVRSTNPGYFFNTAGYRLARTTGSGPHCLEKTVGTENNDMNTPDCGEFAGAQTRYANMTSAIDSDTSPTAWRRPYALRTENRTDFRRKRSSPGYLRREGPSFSGQDTWQPSPSATGSGQHTRHERAGARAAQTEGSR